MNKRIGCLSVVIVVAVILGGFWWSGRGAPREREETAVKETHGKAADSSSLIREGQEPAGGREAIENWRESIFQKVEATDDQVEKYLAKRDYSSVSLAIAGLAEMDAELIRQAYEKDPRNSHALLLALAIDDVLTLEEAEQAMDRLEKSDPDNGLPHYLMANKLLEEGKEDKALAQLKKGSQKKGIDTYFGKKTVELEEFYKEMGLDAMGALSVSIAGREIPHGGAVTRLTENMIGTAGRLWEEGKEEEAKEWLNAGVAMSNEISDHRTPSLHGTLLGIISEGEFARWMVERNIENIDYWKISPAEMLKQLQEEDATITMIGAGGPDGITELLRRGDQSIAKDYFQRRRLSGDWEAYEWLRNKINGGKR